MSSTNLDAVIAFIAARKTIPPQALDAARQCVVDWAACAIAGLDDRHAQAVRAVARGWRSQGKALTLYGERMAATAAALVNATLAHTLDYDDVHLGTACHHSAPALAAVLALGMDRGASEQEILEAFIVGYEVGAAAGAGDAGLMLGRAGWNPTGVLGHFSAVAAAAALLKLDGPAIADAFGIAAGQVSGLLLSAGATAKPFQVGKAAMNAVLAAELAEQGGDGAHGIFDEPVKGPIGCLVQKPFAHDFSGLGRRFEITRNSFKPYACCQLAHAPFEAARGAKDGLDPDGVTKLRVFVNPFAITIAGRMHPKNPTEAKFSVAYCTALGILGYGAVPDDFSDARLGQPEIMALADKVELVPTESLERWAAKVEIQSGSSVRTGETAAALGCLERPLGWTELDEKFMAVATPVYGKNAARLLTLLKTFDTRGRLHDIAALLEGQAAAA